MPASPEDGARHAVRVSSIVADLEVVLLRQLAEALAGGPDIDESEEWSRDALTRLRLWRARADRGVTGAQQQLADAVAQVLIAAHTEGYALAVVDVPGTLDQPAPAGQVLGAADDLTRTIVQALQNVPRLLAAVYQETVAEGAREVAGGKVTRLQAAQHVLDRLGSKGITGFRDVAGRNWSLTSYVEMAVRTETARVAIDGHVTGLRDAGVQLVRVSDSPRECPLCRPWEGAVLSLEPVTGVLLRSATSDEVKLVEPEASLDEARAEGLFHPNCTHSISVYQIGVGKPAGVTYDPEGYEAKQRQRAMERKVREWKRREALALEESAAAQARGKVRDWQRALREHVDANDLKRLRRREQIGVAT